MNLQNRLEKLEQATGINEPCEVCEAIERSRLRYIDFRERCGIVEPQKKPAPLPANCGWCLRPITIDLRDFNEDERALYIRMKETYPEGTLCLPENETLWDELTATFDRIAREAYGEHYDQYQEIQNIYLDELAEISRRRAPALSYLCRVPGCQCQYPKTEEEWRARMKGRLAA